MSRSAVLLGLFVLLAASPVTAQTVVQPAKPLDPAQAEAHDAIVRLRDSLNGITAEGARLMHGVGPTSSKAWLQARARNIAVACTRSQATMAAIRPVIAGGAGTAQVQLNARRILLDGMTLLGASLTACETTWKARSTFADATAIREQGPSEVVELNRDVQDFEKKLTAYASTQGFQLPPIGSKTPPAVP